MDNIQLFTNNLFGSVRSLEINGEPWFVGADVASCLGYSNTRDAIIKHVYEEDKATVAIRDASSIQSRNMVIINESGLYSLIFSSNLPTARQFQHWVTSEVLPTMRKIGFDQSLQLLQNEVRRLQEENNYLGISNLAKDVEKNFLEYNIISSQLVPEEEKIKIFVYDPTDYNPELDMRPVIYEFKTKYGIS